MNSLLATLPSYRPSEWIDSPLESSPRYRPSEWMESSPEILPSIPSSTTPIFTRDLGFVSSVRMGEFFARETAFVSSVRMDRIFTRELAFRSSHRRDPIFTGDLAFVSLVPMDRFFVGDLAFVLYPSFRRIDSLLEILAASPNLPPRPSLRILPLYGSILYSQPCLPLLPPMDRFFPRDIGCNLL